MEQVKLVKNSNVAIISVVRPEALNALSRAIIDKIDEYIDDIISDEDIRCLVLYSEKNFAAGADIRGMAECNVQQAEQFTFSPTYNKIADMPIPVIAAVEGYALGGGMELALTADIRIASETAKIGFPEITLGIMPGGGGTIRATRIIGEAYAKELIFTGDIIDAARSERIGIVNKVVAEGTLFDEAMKLANKIARRAPVAMKTAKQTIKAGLEEKNQNEGIEIERVNWVNLFDTEDQKEGMRAFVEKRKPVFRNR